MKCELQGSNGYYRSILKAAIDGYWRTDTNGQLLEVNDAYCKMSGYSENELLAMHISDLEFLETPEIVAEHLQQVILKGSDRFETQHRRKDGTIFDVEISILYRPEEGGQRICFLRDITKSKHAFAEIKKANERMQLAADSAQFGIWDLDIKKNNLEWDDWMFRLYGMNRNSFGGAFEAWQAGVHPDDLERCSKEVEQALRGEKAFDTEFRIIHADSGIRYLRAFATVTRDSRGEPIKMTGVNFDITDRKKAEAALKDSEEKYRVIFDQSLMGIYLHDFDGRILDVNQNACIQSGYSKAEFLKINVFDLHPDIQGTPNLSESTIKKLWHQWQPGERHNYKGEHQRKDGTIFPIEVSTGVVNYGGAQKIIAIVQDITERKRLEEGLRQAQKMESIGRLAGGIAHDFNNMLGVIIGQATMALEEVDLPKSIYERFDVIRKAGERSANLTRQLLGFARKQNVSPKVLDLNETVSKMTQMLQRLIGEDIDLAYLPGQNVWPVNVDPNQIDQILANLCINARDAIGETGKITIETDDITLDEFYCKNHAGFVPGDYVQLAVSDNGCGMDAQTLEKIYDPFFTTKDIGKGTGLGLSTVYGIVKQNDGFINVYSEPDQGTTFKIYLPRYQADEVDLLDDVDTQTIVSGHETILVVEDEPLILEITETMLEKLGYAALIARTPREAITIAQEHKGNIDLLLTDVVMPEMNGRDLAQSLLSLHPNIKQLFMSGYTSNVISHHGVLEKGVDFIQKPFSFKELGEKVRQVLEADKKRMK